MNAVSGSNETSSINRKGATMIAVPRIRMACSARRAGRRIWLGAFRGVRSVVTVIVCVITGFVTTWLTVDFDFSKDLVASILTVLIAAQASYLAFFKPTKVAPAIERATSGGDSGP